MSNILVKVLSAGQKRKVRKLGGVVDAVNGFEPQIEPLSDADLRAKTASFRAQLADGADLDDLLPEAFACAREAARRTIGQRPFDVQVIGGAVLHAGGIAEMKTGEGKTLAATLPVYLNALTGNNVHVVTVNDYLARRDAEWMGSIYRFLGLTVGAIQNQMRPADRRPIYAGDIVYGTNSEFGFDYLRDNMAWQAEDLVQRGYDFAIVDEVDSILIDEARTPLIISGPAEESAKWYYQFASIAKRLQAERDYEVDEAKRTVAINEDGVHRVEEILGIENLYDLQQAPLVHYLESAVRAKELYRRDKEYVVADGSVVIVDEFTGRTMPGRRWSDGIHQAVEAKEGVRIREEHQTLATITIQNYFRMYEKLAGMTGTAKTEAVEFEEIYGLEVFEIPTNRPIGRDDRPDFVYVSEKAKWEALVEDIKERQEKGQPVLVGTVSIEKNERLARLLERHGVPHQVLNARHHEREADIIAQAGKPGAVTVATNMAGRGVDIILGGNPEIDAKQEALATGLEPETEAFEAFVRSWVDRVKQEQESDRQRVLDAGGLYVLGTERHDSRRIDNQLRGRSGRQGDPGESRFYLALDDELMQLFGGERLTGLMERLRLPEDMPIENKMVSRSIEKAQSNVERQHFEARKNILKYDDVLNTQREIAYGERTEILRGQDLSEQALEMVEDVVLATIDTFANTELYEEDWDLQGLVTALTELYPTELTAAGLTGRGAEELNEAVLADAHAAFKRKEEELGAETMRRAERMVFLNVLDAAWRDHLYEMDHLREGVGLRAMGQRDPLVEYQREGYALFQGLLGRIREDFVRYIFHVSTADDQGSRRERASGLQYTAPAKTSEGAAKQRGVQAPAQEPVPVGVGGGGEQQQAAQMPGQDGPAYETVRREGDKVGRNDPCPCGSGKKYKRCHGLAS